MSDPESVSYLQPGFDPASLTNPRLRSILVTYNVHYPSNAKKPELVELFNTHVAPQASKILARRARAKRSSMGIVDAGGEHVSETPAAASTSPKKRRTTRPPEEAHGSSGGGGDGDDDEADMAQRRQRRTSPRKRTSRSASFQPAAAAAAVDSDSAPESTATTLAPTASFASSSHAARPPSRRARTKTPQVKLEPAEESTFTYDNPFQSGSSPMSGSSPSAQQQQRRRTTGPASVVAAAAAYPLSQKRTSSARVVSSPAAQPAYYEAAEEHEDAEETEETEETQETQETEETEENDYDDDDDNDPLAPGEEFTPEEQLELAQEEEAVRRRMAAAGRSTAVSASSHRGHRGRQSLQRRSARKPALATPLGVLLLALLGAYAAWYRQEKIAVGFCGLGRPAEPLFASQFDWVADKAAEARDRLPDWAVDWVPAWATEGVPEWATEWVPEWATDWVHDLHVPQPLQRLVEPQCVPCPPHAFCYSDFSVRCESGYLVQAHPLALGGLVPLAPTCAPDGERARRVKAVADKAIEALRDRRAQWECGDLVDDDGQVPADPALDEPVLKEVLSEKRSKKMSKEEFDDLWAAALGDITARDEVEAEPEAVYAATDPGAVPNTRLSSTSLARLPLACAVRRSIRLGVARYRFPLSVLVAAVLAALYARARYRAHRATLARVPALVDLVLERLAAQKELWLYEDEAGVPAGADDSGLLPDPFLFLPQLRDDVLRSTHSLAARERIWKHVRAVVEQNSNVRTGQREGRNGEVGRAWEWIGPVGTAAVGGGGGDGSSLELSAARRRRSGRVSLMPSGSGDASRAASTDEAEGAQREAADAARKENRSALHKRWQESRPIY